jgi:hypothetical protein
MAKQYPICGFVPPYILEAVAKFSDVEESRHACEYTLKHASATAQHRHEECVKAHVSANTSSQELNPHAKLSRPTFHLVPSFTLSLASMHWHQRCGATYGEALSDTDNLFDALKTIFGFS